MCPVKKHNFWIYVFICGKYQLVNILFIFIAQIFNQRINCSA